MPLEAPYRWMLRGNVSAKGERRSRSSRVQHSPVLRQQVSELFLGVIADAPESPEALSPDVEVNDLEAGVAAAVCLIREVDADEGLAYPIVDAQQNVRQDVVFQR